ncbi:MAG: putative nucleic acid-binding Zn-ribbon protein [Kiritimatiellia bacterium]
MTNNEKLLRLQETDKHLLRLKRDARNLPRKREELVARIDALETALKEARDGLMHQQSAIKEMELDVEATNQRVTKYKRQQMEVKDNESYRALETEIREAVRSIRKAEDRELEMMEKLEDAQKAIDIHTSKLKDEENHIRSDITELDTRILEIKGQIEGVGAGRAELTVGIDADLLKRYEAILQNKGDSALVTANNATCGGCYMKIPPQLVHNAKDPEKMTLCSYCGRMLYFNA